MILAVRRVEIEVLLYKKVDRLRLKLTDLINVSVDHGQLAQTALTQRITGEINRPQGSGRVDTDF